ncbi:MAG: NAD-dependent epimerase/dehydratase family protein [Parcubacteria group bacterium]|nr:NAD-dependent epimerase/dehydratase family protein [Parcubacteria group bacterium]
MAKAIFDRSNVVILGGAGFIGSHLCETLVKSCKVICVDNFLSSTPSNINHLLKNPNFIFIKHDIAEPLELEKFTELERFQLRFQGIQEVYNLAVPMNPKDFEAVRMETLLTNTYGTKNALDIALKYNARFLHTSSAVVYGTPADDDMRFEESYVGAIDQLSPRSNYDLGKKMAETFVYFYNQVHGLDGRIVRIFRTYGPRVALDKGHMIPDFVMSALKNKDLLVYGDETFSTSLTYVTDIVDGMIKMMQLSDNPGPVNLGSDVRIPLVDVCKKIIERTNSKSKVRFDSPLLFMSKLGLPDISKAKKILGWIPIMTLDKGLDKTIEYAMASQYRIGVR